MCGISGIYNFNHEIVDLEVITKINNTVAHRGPDAGDVALFKNVALGHRRLSVIDLSTNANQPMETEDKRFTIVYNGEIYNFQEIRKELINEGFNFRTVSDTEVILKAFQAYGTNCFHNFNGMFAISIYDKIKNLLYLSRDQFGIKPLYYYVDKTKLVFGSEMKVIKAFPEIKLEISKQGITEYLWFGNPLGETTIYDKIKEVKPGTFLTISDDGIEVASFFDINNIKKCDLIEEEITSKTKKLLEESVKRHLISDVPVGIFLSGGIDSSAITAFASKHYRGKLKTYSVGFDFDKGINELPLAKKIANQYNTEHHEVHITGNDIINVLENLVDAHDEPFGDAADIPLYLLTKKLKGEIKVVLQGDGGDEFFGGYSRYHTLANSNKWSKLSFLPSLIEKFRFKNTKILRFQRFINAISQKEPYKRNALLLTMESKYSNPLRILSNSFRKEIEPYDPFFKYKEVYSKYNKNINPTQALFFTDAQIILKDTFFEKVDKAVMANSIEVRVPFVDKNLTEFALSIPSEIKTKNKIPKYILKKALDGIVPNEVLYGKKKGFGVPYSYWLKTSLEDYFISQISSKYTEKYLNVKEILRMFSLHKKGKGNYDFILWKTLIFAIWINRNHN